VYKKALEFVNANKLDTNETTTSGNEKQEAKVKDEPSSNDDDGDIFIIAFVIALPLLAIFTFAVLAVVSNCFKKPLICWKKD